MMLTNNKLTTTSLKTAIFIATVMRISNLTFFIHFSKTAEIRGDKRQRQQVKMDDKVPVVIPNIMFHQSIGWAERASSKKDKTGHVSG
jgi:hypothetical protein